MHISPAAYVIDAIGGLTKTSNATGVPVTTVQGWKVRGVVPQKHWTSLIEAARAEGRVIELADFLKEHPAPTRETA